MIPKIIHTAWTSNDSFKKKYHKFRESWIRFNPDWSFYFWDQHNFPWGKFDNISKELLSSNKVHYVVKSDVIRYEILRLYGGIYVDCDVECLKSFEPLLIYESFVGYERYPDIISNCIIGVEKDNPIIIDISRTLNEKILNHRDYSNKHPHVYGVGFAGSKLKNLSMVLPQNAFCPFLGESRPKNVNSKNYPDAYAIHHFSGMDDDGWVKNREV